jgi:hypothetical protein
VYFTGEDVRYSGAKEGLKWANKWQIYRGEEEGVGLFGGFDLQEACFELDELM